MKNYYTLIINPSDYASYNWKFHETLSGSKGFPFEHERLQYSYSAAMFLPDEKIRIFLIGKPGMPELTRVLKDFLHYMNADTGKNKLIFLGYIILVGSFYHSREARTGMGQKVEQGEWVPHLFEYPAYKGYPMIDRLQAEYLPTLTLFTPNTPFVVASFGHDKEKAMSVEQLEKTLNLPSDRPVIPINLDSKEDGMKVIQKLFELNNILY